MRLFERRRSLVADTTKDSKKLWCVRDGIENVAVTGGFSCIATVYYIGTMSGWTRKAPVLTQESGCLDLSITGNPVCGSLVSQNYLDASYRNKKIYCDMELSLSPGKGATYFYILLVNSSGTYFRCISKTGPLSAERQLYSFTISPSYFNYGSMRVVFQITSRSTSYAKIYNMWIE